MVAKEAYEAIQKLINADSRRSLVECCFDERHFGNFWVTYVQDERRLSLVNDRGQLILYEDSNGDRCGRMLIESLYDAEETQILAALAS